MFTGLIQQLGTITHIQEQGLNKTFYITPQNLWDDIRIDESIAHNGICLTVVDFDQNGYMVTAVDQTLQLTTAHTWEVGQIINLERAMLASTRLGGHIVQGHVDGTALCSEIRQADGSFIITFSIPRDKANLIVEKGSITINGISLTVFNVTDNSFNVAIIPYTWEHTNLHLIKPQQIVNIEYDIIGKYMQRNAELYLSAFKEKN